MLKFELKIDSENGGLGWEILIGRNSQVFEKEFFSFQWKVSVYAVFNIDISSTLEYVWMNMRMSGEWIKVLK